jgi:hypothetical protein
VVYGINKEKITVADPASGITTMSRMISQQVGQLLLQMEKEPVWL